MTLRSNATLILLLGGCAAHTPAASTHSTADEVATPCTRGASARIVVTRSAESPAVDPVDTQLAILRSRSFAEAAPEGFDVADRLHLMQHGDGAVVELRVEGDSAEAVAICEWVVERATAHRAADPGETWLETQIAERAAQLDAAEAALQAFDRQHGFVAVSIDDRLEIESRSLLELSLQLRRETSPSLREARDEAEQEATRLNLLAVERARLARAAENERTLHDLLTSRLAEMRLDAQLERPVRLLDPCAACVGG